MALVIEGRLLPEALAHRLPTIEAKEHRARTGSALHTHPSGQMVAKCAQLNVRVHKPHYVWHQKYLRHKYLRGKRAPRLMVERPFPTSTTTAQLIAQRVPLPAVACP